MAVGTNACSNPTLSADLNGWGPLDAAAVSRDTVGDMYGVSWAYDTEGTHFYMPQVSVSPGQNWTFAAVDRVLYAAGTAKIAVDWYTSSGQFLKEDVGKPVSLPQSTLSGGTWTRVSAAFTAPPNATTAHVIQFGDFGAATGTNFKATACDYELATSSTEASVRNNWGAQDSVQSDEYNAPAVDLSKWGLFGVGAAQTAGCSPGYHGNGQRCASQTTEAAGALTVTGTSNGKTGGLWSRQPAFRYGRVEVRERARPTTAGCTDHKYHAVPLLWPKDNDYTNGEIDFAERDVAAPSVDLFVHHDGGQTMKSVTFDSTQFHNYAIDWEPTYVSWYVDGTLIATVGAAVSKYEQSNGGAQMDMLTRGVMCPAVQDIDWIRMFPVAATQYL